MEKEELLFYDAYQEFYTMAEYSNAFRAFCKDAFGADFSQDGFSDKEQIDRILQYIPEGDDVHILDIGCGNGKMLGYLQEKTGAYIHGFDFSAQAIATSTKMFQTQADFQEGVIGEITYAPGSFDVITSMDTMYFAKDMSAFVGQLKTWLKKDGIFFVGYQEGDVVPKTKNVESSQIVEAFRKNKMSFEVFDITRQTYDLLVKKRETAIAHKIEFEEEGYSNWYELLVLQTDYVVDGYDAFREKMARYLFVARNQ